MMQRLMLPLQKLLNKLNRSIKSLEEQIEKKYRKNRTIKKQNTTQKRKIKENRQEKNKKSKPTKKAQSGK